MAAATVARRLSCLAGLYEYAVVDVGLIDASPVLRVKRPRVSERSSTTGLTETELIALLGAAEADGTRSAALITLLALNGLRVGEALALDAPDLSYDFGHRVLTLTRKGGTRSVEALAPATVRALETYLGDRTAGPIFLNRDGGRLAEPTVWRLIRRLARTAGIPAANQLSPHSLRHSYAQRHADAGVPVDVLRELMDHVAVATTMGYYRISLKRKQQAIRSVGSLATDAAGNPAPFTSPTAYQRASVAVPFGNCTEPSNVTAGGGACPIRFQCAGCGFYRPDPSYLPALKQHVADLRADRETARAIGAADYVLANLTAEIDAFARVVEQMQHRLADLASDERAEVEQASRLLRRARAGRRLPLTVNPPPAQTG